MTRLGATAGLVFIATTAAALALGGASTSAAPRRVASTALANHCVALRSLARKRFVQTTSAGGYRATRRRARRAAPLYLKPTDLSTYMVQDRAGRLMTAGDAGSLRRGDTPGPAAEWRLRPQRARRFTIESTVDGRQVAVAASGDLALIGHGTARRRGRFAFARGRRCTPFPEARLGARGKSFKGRLRDGTVYGFADMHLHLAADLRAGGNVIYGETFDRFGIGEALGHDDRAHGPDGSLDATGNLLRSGSPAGTHDTHGWPTFAGWPQHDTYTHQQAYYLWLERVWKAGERLVVAQTVEDEPLCNIELLHTSADCDETASVIRQIARLRALERYVDAQSGGRGRGWLKLVYSPAEGRRAIERGNLAVLIGMEASDALGCSERLGLPQCTRADIDHGLDQLHRLGLRSMFIAHWVDNAFAGAALEGGAKGQFISAMELEQTGHPFATAPCAGADESGGQCNTKGLTDLGKYLVERLMATHMLIETDHLSQNARATVLAMAEARHYPLVSSHTGTGGAWTPAQLRRLYAIGGMASATTDTAPEIAKKIIGVRGDVGGQFFCMGLGTDTGGFNDLSGPRSDAQAHPLRYPFRSVDGRVTFVRQRTGTRTFDLNSDGVAHYGLFADVVADIQRMPSTRPALGPLFHSAESYLRMWRRTGA